METITYTKTMKIKIEQQDINTKNPIENAVRRQHGLECTVDRKFIQFASNPRFPRRLPLSAEDFMYRIHVGEAVQPFEFEL